MNIPTKTLKNAIINNSKSAILEDIDDIDITAELIPENTIATAKVISRERAIIAGLPWVKEVFNQIDPSLQLNIKVKEGEWIRENQVLFEIHGSARSILSGERAALNLLQTLSGTATTCKHYSQLVAGTKVKLLDTRKTLPGLRVAQKYAVSVGGCYNHRLNLSDAFLIKENHIQSCGGINEAVKQAHKIAPGKKVEVEVENLEELKIALQSGADIIMLDNFSPELTKQAVLINENYQVSVNNLDQSAKLEASGGITEKTLSLYAETGVDYISLGVLTKDCKSIDLSLRIL